MKFNFFILFVFCFNFIFASIEVKVGGYPFPPYVELSQNNVKGYTIDLIKYLNSIQNKYSFTFVLTSPKRRFSDLGVRYDIIFFEDKKWGWDPSAINNLDLGLRDFEVFISLSSLNKSDDYFKSFKKKNIILIRGYHYKFSNFNTNEEFLKKNYNALFTNEPKNIIEFVLSKRAKIGIVTYSFLQKYLDANKGIREELYISNFKDQVYDLSIISSPYSPLPVTDLQEIINTLKRENYFDKLYLKSIKASSI